MLAFTGLVFVLVALSYAEGTAAIPETGGAETFTRRAFNDLVGFVTGWALFLDYLIVIALSALFLPHYVGAALERRRAARLAVGHRRRASARSPRSAASGSRAARGCTGPALVVALLDLAVQALIVVLGLALVFSPETLTRRARRSHPGQDWLDDLLFAIPLGFLAYTGLETVANLAEEAREPGRTLPRSLFSAIGLVVVLTVLVATVGVTRVPGRRTAPPSSATDWLEAPLVGIVTAFDGELPPGCRRRPPRRRRALRRAASSLMAVTTSISGCARLAHSMGDARDAAARDRAARAADARLARGDRRDHVVAIAIVLIAAAARRRGEVPREHLLVRRPPRVHARPARRDPAAASASPTCRGRSAPGPDIRLARRRRAARRR